MAEIAVITGADRGIGLELVRQLLDSGYLVFAGRFLRQWTFLEDLKLEFPETLEIVDMDVSDDSSVKAAARYIGVKTEKLDVIINNAAILGDIDATICEELDFEEMQKVFNINALGALRVTNTLLPLLLKGKDKLIVNISSEAGSMSSCSRKGWFAYCMSKAALNIQSVIVHNELYAQGGQVLVIHPGWVRSYMRGMLDINAPLSPEDSAKGIIRIIHEHDRFKGEKPAYLDYSGSELEW